MKKSKWSKRDSAGHISLDAYRPGDRVVLLSDLNGIPAGIPGTIVRDITNEYYPMLWEGASRPRGMYPHEIGVAGVAHE